LFMVTKAHKGHRTFYTAAFWRAIAVRIQEETMEPYTTEEEGINIHKFQ